MFKKLFEATKVSWKGGTDSKKIESLISEYDYHYGRIDDGKQYKKAQEKNRRVIEALKELGVTEFTTGKNKVKVK